MTSIQWTEPASTDFLEIAEWLHARNPAAARRVGRQILDAVALLEDHPLIGRPGRSPDTRELVVTRFPYLVVYGVEPDAASGVSRILILRVLHGAMLWPPEANLDRYE